MATAKALFLDVGFHHQHTKQSPLHRLPYTACNTLHVSARAFLWIPKKSQHTNPGYRTNMCRVPRGNMPQLLVVPTPLLTNRLSSMLWYKSLHSIKISWAFCGNLHSTPQLIREDTGTHVWPNKLQRPTATFDSRVLFLNKEPRKACLEDSLLLCTTDVF